MGNRTLLIKWGTSRGRETYGYQLCTLTDTATGKRYKTCGGGYDLIGAVVAEWLADIYQEELLVFLQKTGMTAGDYASGGDMASSRGWVYGAYINDKGRAGIDGLCGVGGVLDLANDLGVSVDPIYERDNNGRIKGLIGYEVTNKTEREKRHENSKLQR